MFVFAAHRLRLVFYVFHNIMEEIPTEADVPLTCNRRLSRRSLSQVRYCRKTMLQM